MSLHSTSTPTNADTTTAPSSSPPPPPSTPPTATLRILTLNVWALRFISPHRLSRLSSIATHLLSPSTPTYDLVCLQELWPESTDYRTLRHRLSARYPHAHFFLSGAFGSGLATFSRRPLVEARCWPYSLNGEPVHVHHGDWFVGKAAGAVTVRLDGGVLVDVWNTHLVAAGGEGAAHRVAQAYELARRVRGSAARGRYAVLCGDLNSQPDGPVLRVLTDVGGLFDAWTETNGTDARRVRHGAGGGGGADERPVDPQTAVQRDGVTCDSPLNTWSAGKRLGADAQRQGGKRLDYVLFRGPSRGAEGGGGAVPLLDYHHIEGDRGRLRATHAAVTCTAPCPRTGVSLSDHFGVEVVLQFDGAPPPDDGPAPPSTSTTPPPPPPPPPSLPSTTTTTTTTDPTSALQAQTQARAKAHAQALTVALGALAAGHRASRSTQRTHLAVFLASVVVAIALAVGSAFQPVSGVSPVLVIGAVVAGWLGTTTLYSGVVWAEWEKRTLRTLMASMEMELSQGRAVFQERLHRQRQRQRLVGEAAHTIRTGANGDALAVEGTLI